MSDILSASSLLLAITMTMFSLFYSSINEILTITPFSHSIDNETNYQKGKEVRNSKILPLLVLSVSFSIIFIPEAYNTLADSIALIQSNGIHLVKYDTVKTAYVAVTIFMLALSVAIISLALKFIKHLNKLNPNKDKIKKDKTQY